MKVRPIPREIDAVQAVESMEVEISPGQSVPVKKGDWILTTTRKGVVVDKTVLDNERLQLIFEPAE